MKYQTLRNLKATIPVVLACATLAWAGSNLGSTCQAQTNTPAPGNAPQPPPNLPPGVQEVVKLARAGLSEDVILAKIKNDGVGYSLNTDQIIYLSNAGVSQNVLAALMQSSPGAPPATPATPSAALPEPPPLDAAPPGPAPAAPPPASPPPALAPAPGPEMAPAPAPQLAPAAGALLDNFASDLGLNPALWAAQSELLQRFAAVKGCRLYLPALAFGPGGMQMSGLTGPGQMIGVQSVGGFPAPFTFSATAVGMAAHGIPFEVCLVSHDLRQWVTVTGHLGGQGSGAEVRVGGGVGRVFRGSVAVPLGGSSPNYGVWLNYSGSGLPISSLGYKLYEAPQPSVPYTVQLSAGPDGTVSIALLSAGLSLAARNGLPVGPGPFHVLLAGRDGPTYANWQSVQLTPPAPVLAPAPTAVVPATPTIDYFRDQLTPYGRWVEVPGNGLCWQPAVAGGWRPYYDGGHWVHTDEGWYWQSDYPWGDIAFHYGRWSYDPAYGWLWAPGFEFAPAWVVWRHTDEYCGWAPLPPGALFVEGGWRFRGARVGVDFDFGLSVGFFSFVACDHFWEHDFRRFVVPHERLVLVYRRSVVLNGYHLEHGRFVNEGIRVERMAELSHRDVREIKREVARDIKAHEERRNIEERHADHALAASGHRLEATRSVSAPRPEARREAEPAKRPSGPERSASERSTSERPAAERPAAERSTSERPASKEPASKQPAPKTPPSRSQPEKEKDKSGK